MATKIRGTALVPGVSKNGRLYTREAITRAVQRAQPHIAAGRMLMKTHHGAEDDATRVVGQITSMTTGADGAAHFTAQLADTKHGRTIAKLASGPKPLVSGVSIRGEWAAPVRKVKGPGGQPLETADDLTLHGVDFTLDPGVDAARINNMEESARRRGLIFETAPGPVTADVDMPSAQDLAGMDAESFEAYSGAALAQPHADIVAARPRGPFWRGLDVGGL